MCENSTYLKRTSLLLNGANAFAPREKLRLVTIGIGHPEMTLA